MRPIRLLLVLLAAVAFACGGGDDDDSGAACGPEEPPEGTSIDDIGKLASIGVQERPAGEDLEGFANAVFLDFTEYDADAPPTVEFDAVCSTVVGQQVIRTDKSILDSPSVATVTLGGQDFALNEVAPGRLQTGGLGTLDNGEDVSVHVEGGDGDTEFPSFDASTAAPGAPSRMSAELSSNGELVVHWEPAGADAVEIELWVQNPPENFHPVRCVVRDDGCLTVSSLAVDVYLVPTPLDVRMSAVRSSQWDGTGGEIGFLKVERRRDFVFTP